MSSCRNCGATALQELGFIGKLAPFFLKRVFGMRLDVPVSPSPLKQMIRRLAAVPQAWLARVNQPGVFVEMQLCSRCSFLQTKQPFAEEAINRLYLDYRSASYNRERIEYEPSYAAIAEQVGQDETELEVRVSAATAFIRKNVPAASRFHHPRLRRRRREVPAPYRGGEVRLRDLGHHAY